MKRRKYIGTWVKLQFNGVVKYAKIVGIEFHQELKKPVFNMVSFFGNEFKLTREELKTYEVR